MDSFLDLTLGFVYTYVLTTGDNGDCGPQGPYQMPDPK